ISVNNELPKPPVGAEGAPTGGPAASAAPRSRPPGVPVPGGASAPGAAESIAKARAAAGGPRWEGEKGKGVPVAQKEYHAESSGLEYEVTKGDQTHNIELK